MCIRNTYKGRKDQKNKKSPMKMPWVIPMNCEGCGACVNYCKKGCLQMIETNFEGIYVPWLKEPEKCSGCGNCAEACVMGAIAMTSYVEEATNRFIVKTPVIYT